MKNKKLSIIALILSMLMLFALVGCNNDSEKDEIPDENNNENVSDEKNEEEEEYEFAEYNADNLFTNGVTAFRSDSNDKMGFVDKNGDYIIKPMFDNAYNFAENGLARVSMNNQWGYINTKGEFVIEPKFGSADDFGSNGMAHVFYEGKHGFINEKGEWVIENKYTNVQAFAENGLAAACSEINGDYFYGYIDREGNEVVAPQFDEASGFASNGLALVVKDGAYGYIDKTGSYVIEPKFRMASDFGENGLAFAILEDGSAAGYINNTGAYAFVINEKNVYTGTPFDANGLAKVHIAGAPVFVNESGQIVIDNDCSEILDFDVNGIAVAKKSIEGYGYINTTGAFIIAPQYDDAENFVNGYARVELDGKWGFIDSTGTVVVEPQFYRATDFGADGYAVVMLEGEEEYQYKYAIIDTNGNFVIDFE